MRRIELCEPSGLPEELRGRLRPIEYEDNQHARLGNTLLRVYDEHTGPAYLKSAKGEAAKDLPREAERLRWIGDRLRVPEVVAFVEGNTSFLLLSELPGQAAQTCIAQTSAERVMEVMADALIKVHALPIADCPFGGLLESELGEAQKRLIDGLITRDHFKESYGQWPEASMEWLRSNTDLVRDRVFTHGDFFLPNVLIEDGALSGIVDWGLAGIADRHRDFMSVAVTLRLNLNGMYGPRFHEAYGAPGADPGRLEFYATLDRFF